MHLLETEENISHKSDEEHDRFGKPHHAHA